MRVAKIGHASVVVTAGKVRCFMDPILEDPFGSDTNRFEPRVELDVERLAADANLVVLSHSHMDHFSPRTLARFNRSVPVLYPDGDTLIAGTLARLGFTHPMPVRAGQKIAFGGLTLIPTASAVRFPEMGVLFIGDGHSFWNIVDTIVDGATISRVREIAGHPDLVFAKYQPIVEDELRANGLGSDFPYARYGALLREIADIAPRYVAAGSCGFLYEEEWLNDRAFPITEEQFARDVRAMPGDVRAVQVPHGGAVELGAELTVEPNGLPGVRRIGPNAPRYDWRPERGVPPLRDRNLRATPIDALRSAVLAFLDGPFLAHLREEDVVWREKMRRLGARFRIEVVFPDDTREVRVLDLAASEIQWDAASPNGFVAIHTSVTASAIVGALAGHLNSYALILAMRTTSRLYGVHRQGVTSEWTVEDEPLGRVLLPGIDERYVDAELQRILGE